MEGDRMSLCWNKFEETAAASFRYLGASGDFADVTLASEDGNQVSNLRKVELKLFQVETKWFYAT